MTAATANLDVGFTVLLGQHGEPASYIPAGGAALSIAAMFDENYLSIDPQTEVATNAPAARTWSASVPAPKQGDRLVRTATGVTYNVIGIKPDGISTTILVLSRDTQIPVAPSGLTVVLEAGKARLNWTRNGTSNTGVELWGYSTLGDPVYLLIATLAESIVTYLDAAFTPGETFTYKVRNTNLSGPSPFSNQVALT